MDGALDWLRCDNSRMRPRESPRSRPQPFPPLRATLQALSLARITQLEMIAPHTEAVLVAFQGIGISRYHWALLTNYKDHVADFNGDQGGL